MRNLMPDSTWYHHAIAGAPGLGYAVARLLLSVMSCPYRYAVIRRNRRFDRNGPDYAAPVPVISVGNITAGGTGKTPMVIDLVKRLEAMNRRPAVVARGYKAPQGRPNDEEQLIRRHCPGVIYAANPDRAAAIQYVVERCGAEVVLLDDGFQHRRVARDLDIVLVDATNPFGHECLLPRGLLREPISGLARADLIIITRVDQVDQAAHTTIRRRISQAASDCRILSACHRVTGVCGLDGHPIAADLTGKRAMLVSGVGSPNAFETTARTLGVTVVGHERFPDHHRYTKQEMDRLASVVRRLEPDLWLTTEKDAVKLRDLIDVMPASVGVVRIAIDFTDNDVTMLEGAVQEKLRGQTE